MNRFFIFLVKRSAWLGDARIIILYVFLQYAVPIDVFTEARQIKKINIKKGEKQNDPKEPKTITKVTLNNWAKTNEP